MEELEDVRLVVLDGGLVLQFVGMMRRFDADGAPVPLRLEGRQWLARLERVRPPRVSRPLRVLAASLRRWQLRSNEPAVGLGSKSV